ncbi:MAG: hypothetical protein OSA84_10485 [Akkermansiaceae bacterium]|nr:hypothetical protein [Akkermansiaceae bacterium]
MAGAPVFDVGHVERVRVCDGEDVAGILKTLGTTPAELLGDDVLGGWNPRVDG